jgi:hypothetical protein
MPQGLPIQPPQVQEVQGGMRLTPLGLSQLEAEANAVGLPAGIVPALANPGDGNTTTATARAASTPGVYVIDVPDATNSTTTNYAMPVGLTGITAGFLVTGISFIKQGGAGHGSGTNTIQVFNAAAAISDASSYTSKADAAVTAAAALDDANALVAAGGSLVVRLVKDGGGNSAHRVVVSGILIETI